ncbi:MAG TPA: hypothetical protein VK163_01190 [Opitutaceae bacterium]|nr:hypothetical protein [Opitutaceae bacterium]
MSIELHPHDDRSPLGPFALGRLRQFGDMLDSWEEIHLAAVSAGAISPFHTETHGPGPRHVRDITLDPAGTVRELGDADESALWQGERYEYDLTEAEEAGILFRESEYVRHCRNRAGEVATAEAWQEAQTSRETLARQSREAALALTSEGIPAFLPPTTPRASILDPETRQCITPLPLRRVNYFPAVAQQRRSDMVKHLEAFLLKHPDTQLLTLTAGRRLFVRRWEELREAVGAFHSRINHLNKGWLFEVFGFRLVFRGTELGTVKRVFACPFPRERGTETGVWALSVHLHAHCFGRFARKLPEARNVCFCRLLHVHWAAAWNFGGQINAAREACKYPIKPADMDGLENADHVTLFRALRGMKLVQPLGELRETIRDRFAAAIKGRRWSVSTPEGKRLELRFRPDWNAQPRDLKARANTAALRERERKRALAWFIFAAIALEIAHAAAGIARAAGIAGRLRLAKAWRWVALNAHRLAVWWALSPYRPAEERAFYGAKALKRLERAANARTKGPPRNQIVARLAPAHYFDRVSRPALLVWNFNGDWSALTGNGFVREYLDAVRAQIEAAEASIRRENEAVAADAVRGGLLGNVHTSHTTGFENSAPEVLA